MRVRERDGQRVPPRRGRLDGPAGGGTRPELSAHLLEIEGIDSVACRGSEPRTAELWTRHGVGRVGFTQDGLFQRGAIFERTFEGASPAEALAASNAEHWPDAAFSLTALFASERTGDLLVSASPGYDLRTSREWPEHHASHGAPQRQHTVVPVLSSAPLPDRPLRTLDLAGVTLDEYADSDTARLEQGTWRPEVWR